MKLILFLILFCPFLSFSQIIVKENLTKKTTLYYDFNRLYPESTGAYYKDFLGETTMKHGKWVYFDKAGAIIEERNYYKGQLNGPVKAQYSNGKPRQEGYFKLGEQDSVYREWNEDGKLSIEGSYFQDKPSGTWTYYYSNGKQKLIEEFIDTIDYVRAYWLPDSLHTQTVIDGTGEMLTFYTTGDQKEWYNYKNGLKNGPFEEYSTYGFVTISGSFKEGLKDSLWSYAYYTGALEKTSTYVDGELNGPYHYYFDNGQINVEGQYSDGKKTGIWTWYTNKGTKDMQGSFKNDMQHGKWTYWHPTGEVSYYAEYKDNQKHGLWTYLYKNGNTFKKGSFSADEKNGKWETWYEDGTLLMSGDYLNGKEEGLWKNYWETGKLKNEATFKDAILEGEWKSYYPSGKPKLTGKYKDGFKTGEWIDYFENGKPKDIGSYKVVKQKSKMEYGPMKDHVVYESVKDGHWTSFSNKDYKKTEEGDYNEGEKTGTWYDYYPGGKVPAVTTEYKNGKLDGKMKEFDRRGNLISETDYKDGLKHGKMKIYDKRGKVAVERDFEFGQQVIKTENKGTQFNPGG